jgi:dTDP-glucose 4,6-dehydratase
VRIVVAGGGGFIGSHLCDALLQRGDEVVAVDNFLTGRRSNLSHLAEHPRFQVIEHDVTEPIDLAGPIDAVMDLASPASPVDFATIPLEILAVGSNGTRNLIELALAAGARFFLASTSEVYGDPLVHPQPETYWGNVDPTGPRSCYDEAKRFAEALTMAYVRTRGLDARIARIFNTYGERMRADDGRVVTNFCVQALRDEPITVYGDGRQTRSFCYVSDEVDGLLRVLEGPITDPVNVGNPHEITIVELAQAVIGLTGSASRIEYVELPPERTGDPAQRRPDITMASTQLGWAPTVGLDEGLTRTVEALRREIGVVR